MLPTTLLAQQMSDVIVIALVTNISSLPQILAQIVERTAPIVPQLNAIPVFPLFSPVHQVSRTVLPVKSQIVFLALLIVSYFSSKSLSM